MDNLKQGGLLVCRLSARAKCGPSGCKWRQSGSRPKTGHCGGRGDAYLAARAPSGRLPAAVATRSGVEAQRGTQAERSRSLASDRQPNKKEKRSFPETYEEGLDLGSEVNVVLAPLVSGGRKLSRALVAAGKEEEG